MSRAVFVLHHLERPSAGHALEQLRAADLEVEERDLRRGDPLPDLDRASAVISLGGEQSVREIERYPYLLDEARLLREAVARAVPTLGVCLGASS